MTKIFTQAALKRAIEATEAAGKTVHAVRFPVGGGFTLLLTAEHSDGSACSIEAALQGTRAAELELERLAWDKVLK